MHLLGYGIDPASADLRAIISQLLEGRDDRNPRIIAKLQSLNVAISMEEVEAQARIGTSDQTGGHKPIGRPHIAAVLLKKGYVSSIKQAFDKYLAPGGLAYVDKERVSRQQIIDAIHRSGGVCVLAHPFQLHTADEVQLEKVIKEMVDLGLDGIEVLHSDHDQSWIDQCTRLADKFGLLKTGGSDFHGSNKKEIALGLAGGRTIPRQWFDALRCASPSSRGHWSGTVPSKLSIPRHWECSLRAAPDPRRRSCCSPTLTIYHPPLSGRRFGSDQRLTQSRNYIYASHCLPLS